MYTNILQYLLQPDISAFCWQCIVQDGYNLDESLKSFEKGYIKLERILPKSSIVGFVKSMIWNLEKDQF